jgi:hypothetical protein
MEAGRAVSLSRRPNYALRITHYALRFAFRVSRFTFYESRTIKLSRQVQTVHCVPSYPMLNLDWDEWLVA